MKILLILIYISRKHLCYVSIGMGKKGHVEIGDGESVEKRDRVAKGPLIFSPLYVGLDYIWHTAKQDIQTS